MSNQWTPGPKPVMTLIYLLTRYVSGDHSKALMDCLVKAMAKVTDEELAQAREYTEHGSFIKWGYKP